MCVKLHSREERSASKIHQQFDFAGEIFFLSHGFLIRNVFMYVAIRRWQETSQYSADNSYVTWKLSTRQSNGDDASRPLR